MAIPPASAPGLPGMSTGTPAAAPLSPAPPAGQPALAPAPVPPAKIPFGGNVGRKFRADGLKPGSPEALAADRAKDARRKAAERAAKAATTPPPPLPPAGAGAGPGAPAIPIVAGQVPPSPDTLFVGGADPVVQWCAEDFRQVAPELVELAEAWRVDSHTRRAVAGKLPGTLVDEIGKDAAFPPGSKRSLSTSSPATLAKMFNALKVPVTLKSVITVCPALVYIVVRDLQMSGRIEKLIAASRQPPRETKTPGA